MTAKDIYDQIKGGYHWNDWGNSSKS
jgi:hypothetical protein